MTFIHALSNNLLQGALGFELWSMSDHILFDNLLVTDSLQQAEEWATDSFDIKRIKLDKQAVSINTTYFALFFSHKAILSSNIDTLTRMN